MWWRQQYLGTVLGKPPATPPLALGAHVGLSPGLGTPAFPLGWPRAQALLAIPLFWKQNKAHKSIWLFTVKPLLFTIDKP